MGEGVRWEQCYIHLDFSKCFNRLYEKNAHKFIFQIFFVIKHVSFNIGLLPFIITTKFFDQLSFLLLCNSCVENARDIIVNGVCVCGMEYCVVG